jgi:hypothetical protein
MKILEWILNGFELFNLRELWTIPQDFLRGLRTTFINRYMPFLLIMFLGSAIILALSSFYVLGSGQFWKYRFVIFGWVIGLSALISFLYLLAITEKVRLRWERIHKPSSHV